MPKKRTVSQSDLRVEDENSCSSSVSGLPSSKRRRRAVPLQYDPQEICQELFETIRNHKNEDGKLLCEAFIRAPKRRTEPEYYNVVSQPMDLIKIHNKLKSEEYLDVEQFSSDVQLIIDNSKAYYQPGSQEYIDACELWDLFSDTKSVLLSEVLGDMHESAISYEGVDEDTVMDEEEPQKQESSMNLRERRYTYREFLPIKAHRIPKEDLVIPKTDEDDDMEELFTAVATATDGGRCISEAYKVLPSRTKYPVYFEVIKDPIDLRTIAQRLQHGEYNGLDDLVKDLNLMVSNAKAFNEPGSQIYRDAVMLKKVIHTKQHELQADPSRPLTSTPKPVVRSERIRTRKGATRQLSALIAALPDNDGDDLGMTPSVSGAGEADSQMGEGDDAESGLEGSMFGDEDDPLWILFKTIRFHKNSLGHCLCEPFLRLPNRRVYPDYYDEIKKPIALLKIQRQLKNDRYKDLDSLCDELNLVFDNAKLYNVEDSQIHKDADTLQQLLASKAQELRQSRENYWGSASEMSVRQTAAKGRRTFDACSTTSEDSTREGKRGKGAAKKLYSYEDTLKRRLNVLYKSVYDCQVGSRALRDIFMSLPSKKDYPDYYKFISEPIDLTMIENKIKTNMYPSQEALVADFELMFNNARHYNEESSQVYKDACTLEKTLMSKVQSLPAIDGGPSGASKRQPGSAMSLNSKLTEMYNAIRDFKDAKLRVLSTPFMKLPLKSDLPDYYEVIKKPIDMNKVFQRLINHQYTSLEEMTSDFVLMFDNACKYNEPDSLIYKDALTLQRVCLEKKQELCTEDDSKDIPDVKAAVHELMYNLFISTYNYTDEEGRCLSDSFLELPSKIEDGTSEGGMKMAPCFEQVKSNLDKGRYRRMDRFQEDMFEVFEFARKVSQVDSQVYEDSLELQQFFMRTRDELCKNGEVLLTPALSFTELHFQKALEKERLDRTSKERELQGDEERRRDAADKEDQREGSVTSGDDYMEYGNETYYIGDYVYIEPREKGQDPHIVCIEKFEVASTDAGAEPHIKSCWFLRPNETYHLATRKFLQKEVFKSDFYDSVGLSKVLGKCYVMSVKEYFKFKPEGFLDKDVFVCESRYSGRTKTFKKIKMWNLVAKNENVQLVPRDRPLTPVRVASVFADKTTDRDSFVDDGQTQVLDKVRQEVAIESGTGVPDDGAIYYEQIQTPTCWVKLDDCVCVRSEQEDRPSIVKIEKIWKDISGNAYVHGPFFLHPAQTEHSPTRLFYQREVFRSSVSSTHLATQILRRCAVLSVKDYCTMRPTEIPETDIYICESKYKEAEKVIMKFKEPMKKLSLSIFVCDDENYFFKKPIVPNKEPSPLLPSTEDCNNIPEAEETLTNMDSTLNDSYQANETWQETATPEPVAEKKKKSKKGRTVSGYIVYAAECRKDIQSEYKDMSFGEISRIVGSNWKALPKEQKEYYEAKARRVMEKHNQEQAEAERRENEAAAAAAAAAAAGHSGDAAATHPSPRTKVNGLTSYGDHIHEKTFAHQGALYPQQTPPHAPGAYPSPSPLRPSASIPANLASTSTHSGPMAPPSQPLRPPSPMFVSVPPRPQRVLHSEAYLRYIESLNPADCGSVGGWERSLYASPENAPISNPSKLPVHWLANGSSSHHDNAVNALWALRDLMMKDALTVSRTLDFNQL